MLARLGRETPSMSVPNVCLLLERLMLFAALLLWSVPDLDEAVVELVCQFVRVLLVFQVPCDIELRARCEVQHDLYEECVVFLISFGVLRCGIVLHFCFTLAKSLSIAAAPAAWKNVSVDWDLQCSTRHRLLDV